jgi:hypothetical protein
VASKRIAESTCALGAQEKDLRRPPKRRSERVHSERVALKKRFWKAYDEQDEALLCKIESRSGHLQWAARRAEKALKKARAASEGADFDEVGEGFALKAKGEMAEE